jgi:hypothetical protein
MHGHIFSAEVVDIMSSNRPHSRALREVTQESYFMPLARIEVALELYEEALWAKDFYQATSIELCLSLPARAKERP